MTRIGTPYFINYQSAFRYYQEHYYPDTANAIDAKLMDHEIYIGTPTTKPGESLQLDADGRWEIQTQEIGGR